MTLNKPFPFPHHFLQVAATPKHSLHTKERREENMFIFYHLPPSVTRHIFLITITADLFSMVTLILALPTGTQ